MTKTALAAVVVFLTGILGADYAAAAYTRKRDQPDASRIFETYACPILEFQSSRPGKCPKCGMELTEKK